MSVLPKRQSRNRAQRKKPQPQTETALKSGRRRTSEYLEFELEAKELQRLQDLAQGKGCTVFEMGITLLKESLYRCDGENDAEDAPGAA